MGVYFYTVEFAPVVVAVARIQGDVLIDVVTDARHYAQAGFGFAGFITFDKV